MIMMKTEEADPQVAAARVRARAEARARAEVRVRAGVAMKKRVLLHAAIVPLPAAQAEAAPAIRVVDSPACPKKKYAV